MPLDGEAHPRHAALRTTREQTLAHLSESFARDELSLDDFERRVDRAYACAVESELTELVADLNAPRVAALVPTPETALVPVPSAATGSARLALAVFGNVERRVAGAVASGARVLSIFGNVELDLRELTLPPGVTELHVRAVFGNVELTVPPGLAVECHGAPVFGSFASLTRVPRAAGSEAVLRIVGAAVFGNVEIKTLPSRALLAEGEAARALPSAEPRVRR
jgi:hypothetical protein